VANEPGFIFSTPLIVDISIGTLHGIPQPSETRMKEPHPPYAGRNVVTLEDADPADGLSIGLPVIEDNKADAVSASDQLLAEEDLLSLCSTDVGDIFPPRERRVGLGCHKADGWAL